LITLSSQIHFKQAKAFHCIDINPIISQHPPPPNLPTALQPRRQP
jgi:hypothetical protein